MKAYHQLLVPIDFSHGSERAIIRAVELQQHYQAKLILLTVVEPLPAVAYSYMGSADIEEEMIGHAKQQLSEWGQKYGIDSADQYIVSGHTKSEITNFAKKINADLIIVGSHGHHSILSHVLGSTSQAISQHALCDVLIIRKQAE